MKFDKIIPSIAGITFGIGFSYHNFENDPVSLKLSAIIGLLYFCLYQLTTPLLYKLFSKVKFDSSFRKGYNLSFISKIIFAIIFTLFHKEIGSSNILIILTIEFVVSSYIFNYIFRIKAERKQSWAFVLVLISNALILIFPVILINVLGASAAC
jgi:hypothetical protein